MAQFSRVTPTGWVQGDDASSFSRVTPTGWVQITAAGGTTYNQSVSGSLTTTSTLIRDISKGFASSITLSAGPVTGGQFAQSASGSITLTSSIADAITFVRAYSSSISLSGSLAKPVMKILTGSLTLSGALVKNIIKGTFSSLITIASSLSSFKVTPAPSGGVLTRGIRFMRKFLGRR